MHRIAEVGTMEFDQNRGPAFVTVFGSLVALAILLVLLRIWVRIKILHKIGLDDYIMMASLVLVIAAFSCLATSVHYGLGKHTASISHTDAKSALKLLWVAFCMTPSAEATAKISISLMLIRITTSIKWKRFFYFLIVLFMSVTIMCFFGIILSCIPIQRLWDPSVAGSCNISERTGILYVQGISASLYDVILGTAPVILLWEVQIGLRTKFLLCGLLAMGFITAVTGILRTRFTAESEGGSDATYTVMTFLLWKMVEISLSIIVGCLPTLRPLVDKKLRASRKLLSGAVHARDDSYMLSHDAQPNKTGWPLCPIGSRSLNSQGIKSNGWEKVSEPSERSISSKPTVLAVPAEIKATTCITIESVGVESGDLGLGGGARNTRVESRWEIEDRV